VASGGRTPTRTAVVVGAQASPTREGDVHRLRGDLEALHRDLLTRGPYRDVVDESGASNAPSRWQLLVHHVPPGGTLRTRLPSAADAGVARRKLLALLAEVSTAMERGARPPEIVRTDDRPRHQQDVEALAASLVSLRVDDGWVHAERSAVATLATVPERQFDDLLAARPALGRVLTTVPAQGEAPALALREHHDVVLAPRQVAYAPAEPAVVLPASFRFPKHERPHVRSLVDWSRRAVLAPVHDEPVDLPGAWFHLDNVMRGHFGHALTEQLSLTWAWDRARERHPGLRAVALERPGAEVAAWEHELYAAAGVDEYVVLPGPARVETLVAATPAYAIGSYVHPEVHATWARAGEALAARAAPGPRPPRVFLTRLTGKRSCTDAPQVEALAAEHGFTVLRPETLPLSTQVAVVRSAEVVAGFAGSAMFHLALTARPAATARPTRVVVVASDTYHAHNERQICASLGHDLTLVRGRSAAQEGAFTDVFHSDYTLDAEQWAQLRQAFASLDG
jgi:capsular polysaccharide biosynthesis protein